MNSIDDLVDSDPDKFFDLMRLSIKDYFSQKMTTGQDESSGTRLITDELMNEILKDKLTEIYSGKLNSPQNIEVFQKMIDLFEKTPSLTNSIK